MTVPTDQQILDAAKEALYDILQGKTKSSGAAGQLRLKYSPQEIQELIEKYEAKIAATTAGSTPRAFVLKIRTPS